jgi:excisionase family DNA binding protein
MTSSPTRAFSIREFCLRYAIGRTKAYAEISSGHLRAVKAGRRTLIPKDSAEAWLAALPDSKGEPEACNTSSASQSEPVRESAPDTRDD